MITLQINSKGAWRHVVDFDASRRDEVILGLAGLASALGKDVQWFLLTEEGKREWLPHLATQMFPGWDDVTPSAPAPNVDVMVTVWDDVDAKAHVYMAYRSGRDPDLWRISGTEEPLPFKPYAFGPIQVPARREDHVRQEVTHG